MPQVKSQYSAAQVLEAGRQAEAEGRPEALQFYHYLVDYHPRTPEAAAAREAITRLSPPAQQRTAPNGLGQGDDRRKTPPPPNLSNLAREAQSRTPPPARSDFLRKPDFARTTQAQDSMELPEEPEPLPAPRDHYRFGRIVAATTEFFAWLAVLAGIAATLLARVASDHAALPLLGHVGIEPQGALTIAAFGTALSLLCRLVRAQFDAANAARDLVAIERVRAREREES